MDIATLLGILLGLGLMVFGIASGDAGFSALKNFIHVQSFIITFGGTITSVLTSCTIKEFVSGLKSVGMAFKVQKINESETIEKIIELSNVARKEGLLALEEVANSMDDAFLKKGLLLIVDGNEPELVRAILETELACVDERHKKYIHFWENVAALGPAWGMIGTLIGLINMLKDLQDASSIGPNMSTALITTLYGSMIANWIATPIATKLSANNNAEYSMKQVMIEGLLSIQAGENPRVIEEKLKSFMSPNERKNVGADGSNGGGVA